MSEHQKRVILATCTACKDCVSRCPTQSIFFGGAKIFAIDYDSCEGCGICESVCPENAIAVIVEEQKAAKKAPTKDK